MRTRRTMTISLPPGMLKEVEAASKAEHRTHSELVREALRTYLFRRYPAVSATEAELAAIARGRADIGKGKYVTLDRFANDLESANRKSRRERAREAAR